MLCVRSSICFCVIPTLWPSVSLVARSRALVASSFCHQVGVLLVGRRQLLLRRSQMVLQPVAPHQCAQRRQQRHRHHRQETRQTSTALLLRTSSLIALSVSNSFF